MVTEDFSFPKITNPLSQLTSLPSLWRVSSLVYPEYGDHNEEDVVSFQRKSFSISHLSESDANKRVSDDPDKMDMLWEEFNEELKRVASLSSGKSKEAGVLPSRRKVNGRFKFKVEPSTESSVEFYYGQAQAQAQAQALKMTKTGIDSGMIYHKRRSKSMLAAMKILKKIFYLRKLDWVKS